MSPEPPDRRRPPSRSLDNRNGTATVNHTPTTANSDSHSFIDIKPSLAAGSSRSVVAPPPRKSLPPQRQPNPPSRSSASLPHPRQRPIQPQLAPTPTPTAPAPSQTVAVSQHRPASSTRKQPRPRQIQTESQALPQSQSSSTSSSASPSPRTMLTATRPQNILPPAYDVYNGAGSASGSGMSSWGMVGPTISPSRLTFSSTAPTSSFTATTAPSAAAGRGVKRPLAGGEHSRSPSPSDSEADEHSPKFHKDKRSKRKGGKACVYCRRSHMVCEGGRPCERCIKRDIAHLCRDVTPPVHPAKKTSKKSPVSDSQPLVDSVLSTVTTTTSSQPQSQYQPQPAPQPQSQVQPIFGSSTASWPLLPDSSGATGATFDATIQPGSAAMSRSSSNNGGWGSWGVASNGELGALSEFIKSLEGLDFPAGLLDGLTQADMNPQLVNNQTSAVFPSTDPFASASSLGMTNGFTDVPVKSAPLDTPKLLGVSPIDQYLLAAADQPDGSRASRLTQVIRAKHEAGLLRPYDYVRGYERMNRWMESGRASPKRDDGSESLRGKGRSVAMPIAPPSGSSISPESRRRILAALAGFRPKFRQIARTLTDVDLVFVEEAIERLMLQYDRALASIHTPSCIWRRTGEIQKANQEFAKLTGIPAHMFRNGQLCVYELMDEDSAVRYWESYGKVAFDKGQSHIYTHCTLKVPRSLTRIQSTYTTPATLAAHPPPITGMPELNLPQPLGGLNGSTYSSGNVNENTEGPGVEQYSVIRTCFSITIRRDKYNIPVAIMGQWIPF